MARSHNRVSSRLWTGRTGRELRGYPHIVRVLQEWLLTCEAAIVEPYGLFHFQLEIALLQIGARPPDRPDVGTTRDELVNALAVLEQTEFCSYDPDSEWIWIREMAAHQVLEAYRPLKPADWRVKAAQRFYDGLPNIRHLGPFFDHYRDLLLLQNRREAREKGSPFQGANPNPTPTPIPPIDQKDPVQEEPEDLLAGLDGNTATALARVPRTGSALAQLMEEQFAAWWKLYPVKTGKAKAWVKWCQMKPPFSTIMDVTQAYIDSVEWEPRKDGRAPIPYPATFLHNRMWEDSPRPRSAREQLGSRNADMARRVESF